MAKRQEVRVPDLGDFDEVEIVEVMVGAGDQIAEEDPLITLETEKAAMEVPSPFAGSVTEMLVATGMRVSAGDVILVLDAESAAVETCSRRRIRQFVSAARGDGTSSACDRSGAGAGHGAGSG
jgi:pyruvate/2-oxoglutarate dehydrogenase complex dihydrolipoamide acyltransferase (E2) component